MALCTPWLDQLLQLLQPRLILPVGSLALSRFLPGRTLDEVIGKAYTATGTDLDARPRGALVVLPLPHPSGQSRWLNEPRRAALLERALQQLRELAVWAETAHALE